MCESNYPLLDIRVLQNDLSLCIMKIVIPCEQQQTQKLILIFAPPLSDGFTPLMIASCSGGGLETGNSEEEEDPSAEIISDFIYQGANLHNQTDRTGETALHLAARYARSDAAKRLLESSADANVQDNMGRSPLHAAVAADAQGVFQVTISSTGVSHLSRL